MDLEPYEKNGPRCISHKRILRGQDLYRNVKFLFPYEGPNIFHAELAASAEDGAVIANSNSYIDDFYAHEDPSYEKTFHIYARLNRTYETLYNSPAVETIEECVCSFMTPFDSVNFGHSLSVVFDFIHQYRKKGLSVPIVVSSVARTFPNCLRILELFFDDIRVLDVNKVYHFNEIYFFEQVILDISRHPDVIKETVDRALVRVPRSPSFTRKKVFLVKLANRQTNIITAHTAFEERLLVDRLRQTSDWVVIQPETMNIYEIIAYLVDASLIVTSEGAISYGHGIFFNRSAPLYFLRQSKSTKPYLYIDWMIHLQVGRFLDDHRDMIIGLPTTYPRPPVRKGPLWFLRR